MTPDTDPSGFFGTVGALVGALLGLATAFGVALSQEQVEAILTVWAALAPILTALVIRRYAWAPKSVRDVQKYHE